MKDRDNIWTLIARKLSGEATKEELLNLDHLLSDDAALKDTVDRMNQLWNTMEQPGIEELEQAFKWHITRMKGQDIDIKAGELIGHKIGRNNWKQSMNPLTEFSRKVAMLQTYVKIALRNAMRQKAYTAINVLGLSLGICACIVIYLITSYEFSFDKFHPDANRIYRITAEAQRLNGDNEFLNSPVPKVASIEHEIRGFEAKAAIHFIDGPVTIPDNSSVQQLNNRNIVMTGSQYFDIFKYEWLAGNSSTALQQPYQLVLTAKQARLYFGNLTFDKMIGRTVIYQDSLLTTVTGIVKDWEQNTDFPYTDFISISTASNSFLRHQIPTSDWKSLSPHRSMAFVKLSKATNEKQINAQLEIIRRKIKPDFFGAPLTNLTLQPLSKVHFSSTYNRGDDGDGFRKAYLPTLYILMGLALFILLIAAINFINLSTALSIQRAKEVGVRKVLGGSRSSLILQFLTETFVLTSIAVAISVLFVTPVLSLFKNYIPEQVKFNVFDASAIIFLLILTVATSILAGFYPAKILSANLPVVSLKGVPTKGVGGSGLRKALIVFQFSMSLIFIIATIVVDRQIRFMQTSDKGFSTDAILTINSWSDKTDKLKLLKEKINALAGVKKAILQGTNPMGFGEMSAIHKFKDKQELEVEVNRKIGNDEFIPFYQMKIVAGRNLAPSDSLKEFVINETYARVLGFDEPSKAVGKFLFMGEKSFPVVGVVGDFHLGSFRQAIKPAVIENSPEWQRNIAVRLSSKGKNSSQVKATIIQIENLWKQIYPDESFDYSFLDESISWLFEKEKQTVWLLNVSMLVTIFISCMGLFGLAMFMVQTRTKEIGIRKVLGASVSNIAAMLSKDFAKLVMLSILIASPIAWLFMNDWLQDFAYRVRIGWWIFFVAGIAAMLVALVTVSFHSIKAAIANPARSLRTE